MTRQTKNTKISDLSLLCVAKNDQGRTLSQSHRLDRCLLVRPGAQFTSLSLASKTVGYALLVSRLIRRSKVVTATTQAMVSRPNDHSAETKLI